MSANDDAPVLPWTGERYVPEVAGNIRLEHVHRYLLARELSRGKRVLDIACGEGYGTAILATVAAHVIGVDIAAEVVRHASLKYNQPHVEFRHGSCEAIPLSDHSVDVVVSFETLEHVLAHDAMLREVKRVLTVDGLLMISSPDRHEYSEVLGNQNQYHVKELDRDEFERLLGSYFPHVALAGQRIRAGSLVGPVDASATRFVSFPFGDAVPGAVPGAHAPEYLLALASTTPIDALPIGLLDGGPFAWSADLSNLLVKVLSQCTVELAKRLGETIQLDDASEEVIRGEFTRVAERISEQAQQLATQHELRGAAERRLDEVVALSAALRAEAEGARVRAETAISQLFETNRILGETQARLVAAVADLTASRAMTVAQEDLRRDAEQRSLEANRIVGETQARLVAAVADLAASRAMTVAQEDLRRAAEQRCLEAHRILDETQARLVAAVADLAASRAMTVAQAELRRAAEQRFEQIAEMNAGLRADADRVRDQLAVVEEQATRSERGRLQAHAAIVQFQAALEQSLVRLRTAHAHIPELRTRIASLQTQIDVIKHSRSWRFTAPLRTMRRMAPEPVLVQAPIPDIDLSLVDMPALELTPMPDSNRLQIEPTPPDATLPQWIYEEPTADYVPLRRSSAVETRIKLIAFYLPQFHPIPENDAWWGKGFTEWTSVTRGKPQFEGHYQPHLPGELGFYDLRLPEIQQRQIELAKLFGLHGFCYYHYWFQGKTLLRQPLEQLLARPELDFPFCLCWANESWTRRWDGWEQDVLLAQHHSPEDDLAFIRDIEPALRDPRYIRVDNRLLLMVYRPSLFEDAAATARRWRAYCREAGIGELFIVSTHSFDNRNPLEFGFDAALEFAPNNIPVSNITAEMPLANPSFQGAVYDYRDLVATSLNRPAPHDYQLFRSVTPMWDNEARRPGRGTSYAHSSPERYRDWLTAMCRWTETNAGSDRPFVFVNAWNEWAEGAHLEPDRRYGYAYLEATGDALASFPVRADGAPIVCVSHDAYFHGAQVLTLNLVRTLTRRLHYPVEVILCGPGGLLSEFEAAAPVHQFWAPELGRDAKLAIIERLYDQGARVAICSTSVVGECVEMLKSAGFSVVSLIHELPDLIKAYQLESSVEQIVRRADRLVFPAEFVRDRYPGMNDQVATRALVQPQGIFAPNAFFSQRQFARSELRERLGLSPTARIVLGVGYADHRKGIDLFVEVGKRLLQAREDIVCVWVGNHEVNAFAQAQGIVARSGYADRFVFPGLVRDSDLFFAGADVYLLTSREDPFPSVVLQSLDIGVPVIAFEGAGGFVELLSRGCGVLVPHSDTAAMAHAVLALLDSPEVVDDLVSKGREILAREFSFVNYSRGLVELVGRRGPTVSAVVPNYNYAKYLPARLRSIINQTYPPHEVIFLDDCSTDNSVEVAAEILHGSGLSYRIITNKTNQGTYRQWLRGFREATSELIWIAEADDYCSPDLLERLTEVFNDPELMLAYTQSRQVDEEGRELAGDYLDYTADISRTKWRSSYVRPGPDEIKDSLAVKNTIPNVSAVLMRRIDLSSIEGPLVAMKNAGDWLLYVHLLERGKVGFVSDALNSHRRHASSVTIGSGGLNLMRESMMVQHYVREQHRVTFDTERLMAASLQHNYDYLGLGIDGPRSFKDHPALKEGEWTPAK